jgi:hypothetical protein
MGIPAERTSIKWNYPSRSKVNPISTLIDYTGDLVHAIVGIRAKKKG